MSIIGQQPLEKSESPLLVKNQKEQVDPKLAARFFSDNNGNISSMRLMSLLALLIASIFAIVSLYSKTKPEIEIILYFLIAAFAPKTIQKFAETKKEKEERSDEKKTEHHKEVSLLTDNEGIHSSTRLMSLFALGASVLIATIILTDFKTPAYPNTELILYFLIAAFAPKAVQKFAEK